MDDRIETNRARWDEMAQLHLETYDIEAEDRGRISLKPFELAELGDVSGRRVCHLQCHIGGDSLSLARLGAHVVGVDFSPRSIEVARERARRTGLADRVTFVVATVDETRACVDGLFDIVYTSWGVLCWLPDLRGWAEVVASLLGAGGFLYLAETHPYAQALRSTGWAYGDATGYFDDSHGDYTDADAVFDHPESWQWSHGLGEVATAVAGAGLRLEWLHEHPRVAWHLNDPNLVRRDDGLWELPGSTLPLSYSLKATRP